MTNSSPGGDPRIVDDHSIAGIAERGASDDHSIAGLQKAAPDPAQTGPDAGEPSAASDD